MFLTLILSMSILHCNEDFQDFNAISIKDFQAKDGEISNPKACDKVEHSNFSTHTAHLQDKDPYTFNIPKYFIGVQGQGRSLGERTGAFSSFFLGWVQMQRLSD